MAVAEMGASHHAEHTGIAFRFYISLEIHPEGEAEKK